MSLIGASAGRRLAAGLLDENAGAVRSGLPIGKIRHGVDGVGPHGPVALAAHLFHYHGPASPARVDQQAVAVARLLQVNALLGVRLNGGAAAAALLVKDPGAAAAKGKRQLDAAALWNNNVAVNGEIAARSLMLQLCTDAGAAQIDQGTATTALANS